MAFQNDTLADDIIKNSDIVKIISSYLKVIKKGKNYFAVCPFHDDTDPSLCISPEKQIFNCFVCHTGGNAITFVQKYEHISFPEAMRKVAELSGYHDDRLDGIRKNNPVDEKKAPLLKCLHDLTLYYQYALNTDEGKDGFDYLEKRHLDTSLRDRYFIGYAPIDGEATVKFLQSKGHSLKTIEDVGIGSYYGTTCFDKNKGRVIFPLFDSEGKVIGYSARRIKDSDEAKYVNTSETYLFHKSNVLYNYHIAKNEARKVGYVYVCEGFMDVLALVRVGINSAVALMGTAFTDTHLTMLRALNVEVRLCLDGDGAGQKATLEISKELEKAGISYRVVNSQGSTFKDSDEILNNEGEDGLKKYLNALVPKIDFLLNYYTSSNPLTTTEAKKQLIKSFIPTLITIRSQLELDSYLVKLSKATGFEVQSLRDLINRSKQNTSLTNPSDAVIEFKPEQKVLRKLEFAERELLYQMLSNKSAVDFYEQKSSGFYDEVYREIANFIIEYAEQHNEVAPIDLVNSLQTSTLENREQLIQSVTALYMENTHPKNCDEKLLINLIATIDEEKEKIFNQDMLEQSLEGKDPIEKARIMAEYNRRRMRKKK